VWVCTDWQPWPGGERYEECTSATAPASLNGQTAWGRLVRQGRAVEVVAAPRRLFHAWLLKQGLGKIGASTQPR
jgi:hypothetical protein